MSLKDSLDKPKSYRVMCGIPKIKHGLILSKYSAKAQMERKGYMREQKSPQPNPTLDCPTWQKRAMPRGRDFYLPQD